MRKRTRGDKKNQATLISCFGKTLISRQRAKRPVRGFLPSGSQMGHQRKPFQLFVYSAEDLGG